MNFEQSLLFSIKKIDFGTSRDNLFRASSLQLLSIKPKDDYYFIFKNCGEGLNL